MNDKTTTYFLLNILDALEFADSLVVDGEYNARIRAWIERDKIKHCETLPGGGGIQNIILLTQVFLHSIFYHKMKKLITFTSYKLVFHF